MQLLFCADLRDNNVPRLPQPVAAVDALLLGGRIPRLKHTGDRFCHYISVYIYYTRYYNVKLSRFYVSDYFMIIVTE